MQFFSIFDLLIKKTLEQGKTLDTMYHFFQSVKINKKQLTSLSTTTFLPPDKLFRRSICDYLNMTELEIDLSMGIIPPQYRQSYFSNIKKIAELLTIEPKVSTTSIKPFYRTTLGTLYNNDCLEVLKSLPDDCVDLVFADPPFNLGKKYDSCINDNLSMSQYLNWTYNWLDECVRILKPGGRIFIYNLPKWCIYIATHLSETLTFWDWIAVEMKFCLPIQNKLYPSHYALISFVKGVKANTFNNQRIPLQTCRHCGGEIKDYGGYKSKLNPLGINVSDVWTDIYPVRHKNSKHRKYNELSIKLLDRIISMSTNEGDTVFDPFGGSGTTYVVAELLHRQWIGCELGDCKIIKERLTNRQKDYEKLQKIHRNIGVLFPSEVVSLRKKNGFWNCEEINENKKF